MSTRRSNTAGGGDGSSSARSSNTSFSRRRTHVPGSTSTSSLADKPAVVIDVGSRVVKCGFAGEPTPRCTFNFQPLQDRIRHCHISQTSTSSSSGIESSEYLQPISAKETQRYWDDLALDLLQRVYFVELLSKPKERRVLIGLSHASPTGLRLGMARAVLEYFSAPSVCVASNMGLALLPSGATSGVVVDVGFFETRVIAVHNGIAIRNTFVTSPLGASSVLNSLDRLLSETNQHEAMEQDKANVTHPTICELENILFRGGRVAGILRRKLKLETDNAREEDEDEKGIEEQQLDAVVHMYDTRVALHVVESAIDTLFDADEEDSLVGCVERCALACASDVRVDVVQNVAVCGGLASCDRVVEQLETKIKMSTALNALIRTRLNVRQFTHAITRSDLAWVGASIAASLRTLARSSLSLRSLEGEALHVDHPALSLFCGEHVTSLPTEPPHSSSTSTCRFRQPMHQSTVLLPPLASAYGNDSDSDLNSENSEIVKTTISAPARQALIEELMRQHNPMVN